MNVEPEGNASISLSWLGPFSLLLDGRNTAIFHEPQAQMSGVYLWAVPVNGSRHVNYVGIAPRNVSDRHETHLREYMAGRYVIHKATSFARGERAPLYEPSRSLQPFLKRYTELSVALVEQLQYTEVYFAVVSGRDKRTLERIESALSERLRDSQGKGLAFLDNLRMSCYVAPALRSLRIECKAGTRFEGIPEFFQA